MIGCKKTARQDPAPVISFTDPLASNPNFDLGVFTRTELGDELYLPIDVSKIFHGYTDKISYQSGEMVPLYLSDPVTGEKSIDLNDANGNSVLSFSTAVGQQEIGSKKPWVEGFMYNKTTIIQL
ncbi:MAG: hypothetical protein JST32_08765, partial [Bacteroidetes bacterium]|nr:hypothetical protein [Bacteroidota bacterium]